MKATVPEDIKREIATLLLKIKAFTINCKEPYTYTSGIKSPVYCDNRLMFGHTEERKRVVELFVRYLNESGAEFDLVAGVATAGIPWAALIADKLDKPMVYIRSNRKGHGKGNVIEGEMKKGDKTLIIEDHISTGGSSVQAVETAKECGLDVHCCISVSTYEMEKAVKRFEEIGCDVFSLTTLTMILDVAKEQGMITAEEEMSVLDWKKNPGEWGKRMGFE